MVSLFDITFLPSHSTSGSTLWKLVPWRKPIWVGDRLLAWSVWSMQGGLCWSHFPNLAVYFCLDDVVFLLVRCCTNDHFIQFILLAATSSAGRSSPLTQWLFLQSRSTCRLLDCWLLPWHHLLPPPFQRTVVGGHVSGGGSTRSRRHWFHGRRRAHAPCYVKRPTSGMLWAPPSWNCSPSLSRHRHHHHWSHHQQVSSYCVGWFASSKCLGEAAKLILTTICFPSVKRQIGRPTIGRLLIAKAHTSGTSCRQSCVRLVVLRLV